MERKNHKINATAAPSNFFQSEKNTSIKRASDSGPNSFPTTEFVEFEEASLESSDILFAEDVQTSNRTSEPKPLHHSSNNPSRNLTSANPNVPKKRKLTSNFSTATTATVVVPAAASVASTSETRTLDPLATLLDDGMDDALLSLVEPLYLSENNELTRAMRYVRKRSRVFVSVDLEYWEKNQSYLTEIGISVYDPSYLKSDTKPVRPRIRTCHFIVKENEDKTNGRFVPNNQRNYSYGKSLVLPMEVCRQSVNDIFKYYARKGNMAIIGHNVQGDIKILANNGMVAPKHEVLDTYQMWMVTPRTRYSSLESLLEFFEIPHGLLHNAGNDAYLNMLLFMAMCDPVVRQELRIDDLDYWKEHGIKQEARKNRKEKSWANGTYEDAMKLMVPELRRK